MHILTQFAASRDGNVALMFGLCLVAILGFAGGAIDFYHSGNVRANLQQATDAAALAANSAHLADSEREAIAQKIFLHEFRSSGRNYPYTLNVDLTVADTVRATAVVDVPTQFLGVMGIRNQQVTAHSASRQSMSKPEIALVLDISGSMNAALGATTRLASLKTSAASLINIVNANANPGGLPKYAIIPFNMTVNIGTANVGLVTGDNDPLFTGSSWAGCVMARGAPHTNSDAYAPGSPGANGKWRAFVWPPEPDSGGCINPSNGTNSGYASIVNNAPGVFDVMTAGPNYNCVRHEMKSLSDNAANTINEINALTAQGNQGTILAPGIAWGMRLLSPSAPFTEGDNYNTDTRKIMVVLTDGEQTTEAEYGGRTTCASATNSVDAYAFDPANFNLDGASVAGVGTEDNFSPYGYILESDPFNSNPVSWSDVADDLYNVSIDACDEAKSAGPGNDNIEIFTIAVSTAAGPGTKTYDLLRNCATSPDKFFYATDDTALTAAFNKIADEIINIYIAE